MSIWGHFPNIVYLKGIPQKTLHFSTVIWFFDEINMVLLESFISKAILSLFFLVDDKDVPN